MRFDATLKDLALFVAVYEGRSFTAAAEREHITQSGVSQHIRKLEGGHGVELFIRDAGAVRPTPAADVYYRGCIELLRTYERTSRVVRDFEGGLTGEVSAGMTATFTRSVLSSTLISFMESHPNVRVRVDEAHPRVLAQQVQAGQLDFAIVPASLQQPGTKSTPFLSMPEVLVSARESDVPHCKVVRLADLEAIDLILPSSRSARRQALDRYLIAARAPIARRMELDVPFTMLDIVQKTKWRTLVPALTMVSEIQDRKLTVNGLTGPELWYDCVCIEPARRPLSRASSAFHEVLRSAAERVNREIVTALNLELSSY